MERADLMPLTSRSTRASLPCRRRLAPPLTAQPQTHPGPAPASLPHPPPPKKKEFSKDDMDFQERIVYRSGLGDETTCPPCEWAAHARGRRGSVGSGPGRRMR